MKVRTLLLEIGCEELPSAFVEPALTFMRNYLEESLKKEFLTPEKVEVHGTPRRLIALAYDVPEFQEDRVELVVGPSFKSAFDANGKPTKALLGFARSKGVSPSQVVVVENPPGKKGKYVAVRKVVKGRKALDVLPEVLRSLVLSIPFKKSMRWGTKHLRFARPIRWITALFGGEPVSFEVDGIKSGKVSYGHRFMSPEPFEVEDASTFLEQLENRWVIADIKKRRAMVLDTARRLAEEEGGKLLLDEDLLSEVIQLVEYPYPVLGRFDRRFLRLPKEVPMVVMKDHQRFFSVVNEKGSLLNCFIGFANIRPPDVTPIRRGYERVLRARLEDALFFFEEDKKKPLADRVPLLKGVVFHEKLGSMLDKVERLKSLSVFICESLGFRPCSKVERSAFLCKADLLTEMVGEFPELQGIMGKHYAAAQGEDEEVAQAIEEHYLPRFSGDRLPSSKTGIALSIADKVDNLIGFFGVGLKPTGSADPFSLRRSALGIVQVLVSLKLSLNLLPVFKKSAQLYGFHKEVATEVLEFLRERLKVFLKGKGFLPDTVEAVLKVTDDVYGVFMRASAIDAMRKKGEFDDVLITMRRLVNIIPPGFEPFPFKPVGKHENALFQAFSSIRDSFSFLVSTGGYAKALQLIAGLKPYVDDFFDNVMVMHEDEAVRNRRLSLLKVIADELTKLADFSKLGMGGGVL